MNARSGLDCSTSTSQQPVNCCYYYSAVVLRTSDSLKLHGSHYLGVSQGQGAADTSFIYSEVAVIYAVVCLVTNFVFVVCKPRKIYICAHTVVFPFSPDLRYFFSHIPFLCISDGLSQSNSKCCSAVYLFLIVRKSPHSLPSALKLGECRRGGRETERRTCVSLSLILSIHTVMSMCWRMRRRRTTKRPMTMSKKLLLGLQQQSIHCSSSSKSHSRHCYSASEAACLLLPLSGYCNHHYNSLSRLFP